MSTRTFPQYRKLMHGRNFYRIEDEQNFTEVQQLGSKHMVHRVQAKTYPEMLLINDLLTDTMRYSVISEKEFLLELELAQER